MSKSGKQLIEKKLEISRSKVSKISNNQLIYLFKIFFERYSLKFLETLSKDAYHNFLYYIYYIFYIKYFILYNFSWKN